MVRREISIFLVVGSLTVLVDFLTYRILLWTHFIGIDASKAVGFITGTILAYFANRIWTFRHEGHVAGSMIRFAILYALTLGANVTINAEVLKIASWGLQTAFLAATGTSAALNFIGMKFFVFTDPPKGVL